MLPLGKSLFEALQCSSVEGYDGIGLRSEDRGRFAGRGVLDVEVPDDELPAVGERLKGLEKRGVGDEGAGKFVGEVFADDGVICVF